MNKIIIRLFVAAFAVIIIAGCGALRSLTTKYIDFGPYSAGNQSFSSPVAGTVAVTSSFTISGDVVTKFDKYHGGIDWAGISYTATASPYSDGGSIPDINVKFYTSTTAPAGNPSNVQVPTDASLIDEISLSASNPTITKDADANHNEALRAFIEKTLNEGTGSTRTVYFYFQASTSGPGKLSITGISVKGRAHGSLF